MSEALVGSTQENTWPLPKFRFTVDWGTMSNIAFQEISGLDAETQVIEYRAGNSPSFSTIKMPHITKQGNVTMKHGVFVNDNTFWTWYNQIMMNTMPRVNINIKLLDENGHVTMMWTLSNAWPTKISGTDLKSDGNEIAVESIEIAYETIVIAAP